MKTAKNVLQYFQFVLNVKYIGGGLCSTLWGLVHHFERKKLVFCLKTITPLQQLN